MKSKHNWCGGKFLAFLFFLAIGVGTRGECRAATYFSTDFESGTLDSIFDTNWWMNEGAGRSIAVDSSQNHTPGGSRGLHLQYATLGTDCNGAGVGVFATPHTSFYSRQYIRLGSYNSESMKKLIRLGNDIMGDCGQIDHFLSAWSSTADGEPGSGDGSSQELLIGDNNLATPLVWTGIMLQADTWYSLEFYAQLNTTGTNNSNANGIFRIWINGTQVYNNTTYLWRVAPYTATVNGLAWGYQLQGDPALNLTENRYYDDIVVSDSYVGPISGGGGDAVAPASPSGLSVK